MRRGAPPRRSVRGTVLWLVASAYLFEIVKAEISIRKCCSDTKVLHSPTECGNPERGEETLSHAMINKRSFLPSGVVTSPSDLITGPQVIMAALEEPKEGIHRGNYLTPSGLLHLQQFYNNLISEFCVDMMDGNLVALTCSPCHRGLCINICCPHGQILGFDNEGESTNSDDQMSSLNRTMPTKRCVENPSASEIFKPEWLIGSPTDKIPFLIGSDSSFVCSSGAALVNSTLLYGPDASISLMKDGSLFVVMPGFEETVPNEEFCLMREDVSDGSGLLQREISTGYAICVPEEESGGFRDSFYPASLIISAFFFFLSIVVYSCKDDIRLFQRTTLSFLFNAVIAYLCLAANWLVNNDIHGTRGCIVLAYIFQHSLIGLFSWITAMTLMITQTTTSILRSPGAKTIGQSVSFLHFFLVFCIFQGIPIVVSTVTALMDAFSPEGAILPNMGRYSCTPGQEGPAENFFHSPLFLYVHLIILVSLILNIICFIVTVYGLISHWMFIAPLTRSGSSNRHKIRTDSRIVFNIFVMMGIPWVLEIVSAYFDHQAGFHVDSKVVLVLDIWNLFTGLIVFVVLICKPSSIQKSVEKIRTMTKRRKQSNNTVEMNLEDCGQQPGHPALKRYCHQSDTTQIGHPAGSKDDILRARINPAFHEKDGPWV